jgi:signal transduction histidine kinase
MKNTSPSSSPPAQSLRQIVVFRLAATIALTIGITAIGIGFFTYTSESSGWERLLLASGQALAHQVEDILVAAPQAPNLIKIQETLRESEISETGRAYVVARDGALIAHPNMALVAAKTNLLNRPELTRALVNDSNTSIYRRRYDGLDGRWVIGTATPIEGTQWFIFAEVEWWEALRWTNLALGMLIPVVVLQGFLAVYGFNRLSSDLIFTPLENLQKGAEMIQKGDYQVTVPVAPNRNDEITTVTSVFNDMTHTVRTRQEELLSQAEALRQANLQAQESSRLKSEFLSTMSHELRTPLNAIIGYTGILLEGLGGEIDDEAEEMVENTHVNGQRLLTLINDILDISKIEAGRMELRLSPLAISDLIDGCQRQTKVLADEKGIGFITEIVPGTPEVVLADGVRLTQILVNLLSNAVKFTEKGSVTLRVNQDRGNIIFAVTDTGIGIPAHALDYIFDEFRQVDGSYQRSYGGTGLGLAIVRKLCMTMGGKVTVSSQVGQGSTFSVSLPLKVMDVATASERV